MSANVQAGLTANLAKNGMTVGPPNPAFLAELEKIGARMVDEWLAKAGERGRKFIAAYNALGK